MQRKHWESVTLGVNDAGNDPPSFILLKLSGHVLEYMSRNRYFTGGTVGHDRAVVNGW